MRVLPGHSHRRWLFAGLILAATPSPAIDVVALSVGDIAGDGWRAEGLVVEFDLQTSSATVELAALHLPPPIGRVGPLSIRCRDLRLDADTLACPQARVRMGGDRFDDDTPEFGAAFSYRRRTGEFDLQAEGMPWGDTRVDVTAASTAGVWRIALEAPALTFGTADGTLATDSLAVRLKASLRPRPAGWEFDARLSLLSGQLYVEPVFLDLAEAPLEAQAAGFWSPADGRLAVDAFVLEHVGAVSAEGRLLLATDADQPVVEAELSLNELLFPLGYGSYIQPFLIGTALDSLETRGRLSGEVRIADGSPRHVRLQLEDVHLDDRNGRFALQGLGGVVQWDSDAGTPSETRLAWRSGSVYRLAVGPGGFRARTAGRNVVLLEPVRVAVLDGALNIARLEVGDAGRTGMSLAFEGTLEPLGLEELSRALDWPVFGGTIAGSVPAIEYRDGRLLLEGTLQAEVFDGLIEVEGLELAEPFGARPALTASIRLSNLDLEPLTQAFSFGRIEGRLDGHVANLRLLDWMPVALDASFYTPRNDRSRHRISQQAIEGIAELGGSGATGALSRGFLRFFDDFAYDRIAIGCRLRNGICRMSGLEPHPRGGYYIVKGRLLPRIDVVGYAEDVDWDVLVRQLREATRSEGPIVR